MNELNEKQKFTMENLFQELSVYDKLYMVVKSEEEDKIVLLFEKSRWSGENEGFQAIVKLYANGGFDVIETSKFIEFEGKEGNIFGSEEETEREKENEEG